MPYEQLSQNGFRTVYWVGKRLATETADRPDTGFAFLARPSFQRLYVGGRKVARRADCKIS
jgi:hypothetical protein